MSASVNAEQLCQILAGTISSANDVRRQAENAFATLKREQPALLLRLLLQIASQNQEDEKRHQAAISLRNVFRETFLGSDESVWPLLDAETQQLVKTQLLSIAASEKSDVVRNAIGDVIADLGRVLMPLQEWNDLSRAVETMMACDSVGVQILGLTLCASLEPMMADQLCEHMPVVTEMLNQKLSRPEPELKLAAVGLLAQIVCNELRKSWKPLEDLVAPVLATLAEFTAAGPAGSDHAVKLLQRLTEIADGAGEYFKKDLERVLSSIMTICGDENQLDETRQMAVEFLLTITEHKPKMVQQVPQFLSSLIRQLMVMMLAMEDDEEWYQRELSAESDEEPRNYEVGEYGLDRVALAVGGEAAMPLVFSHVATFLREPTWQHRVSAIVAISQTIEYLPEDKVESQLGEIVDLLLKEIHHEHCRVRFAACRALGQVALDHQPYVQNTYHERVLPVLIKLFDDPIPRVQSQAFAAFINFAEEVDLEDLRPFVPEALTKVMSRLDTPLSPEQQAANPPQVTVKQSLSIREQCITCVAVIAGVLGKEFVPHCSTLVPLMQQVVRQAAADNSRQLQGRAFECLSIIAFSVNMEGMESAIESIMTDLLQLYSMPLESDDPRKEYVLEALRRMIRVLGSHFAPFLPAILPRIFESFVLETENNINDEEQKDYTMICLASGALSCVRTSKLEDMEKNLQILCVIIEFLKTEYVVHCEATMKQLLPLLDLQLTEDIRVLVLSCMAEIYSAVRDHVEMRGALKEWLLLTIQNVIKSASDEEEIAVIGISDTASYVRALVKCLDAAGSNLLDSSEIKAIADKAFELIKQSTERRRLLRESMTGEDLDEEDITRCEKEMEQEQLFREGVLSVLESLMKTHPDLFVATSGESIVQFVQANMESLQDADDRTLAIYVCCDLLDKLKATGVNMVKPFLPQIVLSITNENPASRQAACYAISLVASSQDIDSAIFIEASPRLVTLLNDSAANEKSIRDVTDNACSALIALALNRANDFQGTLQDVINLCVNHLPLISDAEEGKKVHGLVLTQLLQDDNSPFWGRERENVGQLIKMMGAIYKTESSNDDTDEKIRELVKKLGGNSALVAASNGRILTDSEKRGLKKISRDVS